MLKRPITYEDFNGNTITETFYFNLSKPELVELEVNMDGGFTATMQRIIETGDNKRLVEEFKRLILLSYGVKSEDGKFFMKSDQLREEFVHSAAYISLYMELSTDDNSAAAFINGVVPSDLVEKADQDKPTGPPPIPSSLIPQNIIKDPNGLSG
jgi:hypothetical protein